MATICHFRHGHAAGVYIKTRGRTWAEIEETVRHEALHVARPSYTHRQVEAALGHPLPPVRRRRHPALGEDPDPGADATLTRDFHNS